MNYIKELNAFNEWLTEHSLNATEQALWYRLMHYCNKLGWKEEFTVTNTKLADDLHISRQYLEKCRKNLIKNKLILYKKRRL